MVEAVRAQQPARLEATSLSVEGDPIPVTYLAGADGKVEVITDSRLDRFGEQIRTRMTCTEPIHPPGGSAISFAQCSEPAPIPD